MKRKDEHFLDMAEIANNLLGNRLHTVISESRIALAPDTEKYSIVLENEIINSITRTQLSHELTGNIEAAWYKYGEWK
ncbi:hypothetical protein ACFLVL_03660, partial [Chloroflexota bacterium]